MSFPFIVQRQPAESDQSVNEAVAAISAEVDAALADIQNQVQSSGLTSNGLGDGFTTLNGIERLQGQLASGVVSVRQYTNSSAFVPEERVHTESYSAISGHNHADHNNLNGLAELQVVLNGIEMRSRHNDYLYRNNVMSANPSSNERDYIFPRELSPTFPDSFPPELANMPTGVNEDGSLDCSEGTQAHFMKSAGLEHTQVILSYVEMWIQRIGEDAGDTLRHEIEAGELTEQYIRENLLKASGHKNRLENFEVSPSLVRTIDEDGNAIYGQPVFRISSFVIGHAGNIDPATRTAPNINIGLNQHAHVLNEQMTDEQAQGLVAGDLDFVNLQAFDNDHAHIFQITWDGQQFVGVDLNQDHQHEVLIEEGFTGQIPFDRDKARDGVIDETNRFRLVRDIQGRNRTESFDELIDSNLARFEYVDAERALELCPGLDGDGAVIFEEVILSNGDIDQFQDRDGGTLNSAYYNHRYQTVFNDASGRQAADRGFNDPNLFVARTNNPDVINGYSYAIPLEIHMVHPWRHWNPYNIEYEIAAPDGDGSQANPYTRSSQANFYFLPFSYWMDENVVDPADTNRAAFVNDPQGVTRSCWGSGSWIVTPDGSQRCRFPVYPVAHEFSHASTRLRILQKVLREKFPDELGDVL